ncbi:zf-HC2 domain-containing protein [Planosporangium sp. 12N6]|uniref:zf-HC2 domain-containing protein n=1 Tax=Planosporangium spinosum TaxID=3402278 RepID=UPI003CE97220
MNSAPLSCDHARTSLSARLDGEPIGVAVEELQAHLHGCAACRDWLARAEQVTRLVRIQPARVPDLTETIVSAVAADRARRASPPAVRPLATGTATHTGGVASPRRSALRRLVQVLLAYLAAMQLGLAVPSILGAGYDVHTTRELGCFDSAVAIGFLFVAFRPSIARAYAPVAIALATLLTVVGSWDVLQSRVSPAHELFGHSSAMVEAGLLWALSRLGDARPAEVATAPADAPASA